MTRRPLAVLAMAAFALAGTVVSLTTSGPDGSLPAARAHDEEPAASAPALRGLDPVELCAGRETAGKPELTETRSGLTYRFASEENRRKFAGDPSAFSIQFGGACMRMGPLSGAGSPDRWAVHAGRIYVFASESCRSTFLKGPDRYIDRDDAPPSGTPEAVARGAELMELAVKALGGRDAVQKARNVRVAMTTVQRQGEAETKIHSEYVVAFPATYRWDQSGDGWSFAWLLAGDAGFLPAEIGPPVEESVRKHMVREMYRRPVAVLGAWCRGEAKAVALAPEKRGDATFERVSVGIGGATSTLVLDATGRVVEARFRHRSGAGIQDVVRRFSDFRATGGLTLPFATEVEVDGKVTPDRNTIDAVEVDAALPAGRLDPPRAAPAK